MGRKADRGAKLRAAAVVAVLLESSEGEALSPSAPRDGGAAWSRDHRREQLGSRYLFRARTRRSTPR